MGRRERQAKREAKAAEAAKHAKAQPKKQPVGKKEKSKKPKSEHKKKGTYVHRDTWASDVRNPKTTYGLNEQVLMTDANPSVAYEVPVSSDAIEAPALAAVTYAIQRGWTATVPDPEYPYRAWMYIRQQLINYATTGKVDTMYVPYWLAYIGQALMEKKVLLGQGYVNYKFKLSRGDVPVDSPAIVPMGALIPNGLSKHWNVGIIQERGEGVPYVNKIFPPIDVTTHSYTPEQGQVAWSSLIEFLQNVHPLGDPRRAMHKLVPSVQPMPTVKDASAYAVLQPTPGGGYGVGCAAGNVTNETKILCPLLSRFKTTSAVSPVDPVRSANFFNRAGMDTLATTGIFLHLASPKQLRTRHSPIVKFIDIGRFFDTLCCWMRLINEEMLRDPTNVQTVLGDVNGTKNVLCPLTLQEVFIIFRAQMMAAFKDTQFMAQGTYTNPITNTSSAANVSTPLVGGQGVSSHASVTKMKLPLLLVENIRSCTFKVNFPDGSWSGGKPGVGKFTPDLTNPQYYIPNLVLHYKDTFDPQDYEVEYKNAQDQLRTTQLFSTYEDIYPIDQVPAGSSPFIAKRGSVKVNAEVPISMIDGTSIDNYVAINDPAALNKLIGLWNDWVSDKAAYSVPLTEIGSDGGINSLEVITMTDHFVDQAPIDKVKTPADRFDRFKKIEASHGPYASRGIAAITSQNPFDTALWETVQQFLIKPSNWNVASVAGDPRTYNLYQRWQTTNYENEQILAVDGGTAPVMATAHYQLALLNVKQRGQDNTEVLNFIEQEAAKGRGGILSSLAGSLFGETAGKVVGLLPFLP